MKLLINLKVIEKRNLETSPNPDYFFHKPGVFFSLSEVEENVSWESCAARDNTPLDVIQFCLVFVVIIRSKEP